jgi:hypothetical protein
MSMKWFGIPLKRESGNMALVIAVFLLIVLLKWLGS